jgi:hypothetical protein
VSSIWGVKEKSQSQWKHKPRFGRELGGS